MLLSLTIDPRPMKQQLFDKMAVELKKYNSENMERLIHPIKHVNGKGRWKSNA